MRVPFLPVPVVWDIAWFISDTPGCLMDGWWLGGKADKYVNNPQIQLVNLKA
jgi:hypothetical protein